MHRVVNWVLITFCRKIKQPFHNSRKIIILAIHASWVKEGHFGKSQFTANIEIMIHKWKNCPSQVTKVPFTTFRACQLDTLHFLAWQTNAMLFKKFPGRGLIDLLKYYNILKCT